MSERICVKSSKSGPTTSCTPQRNQNAPPRRPFTVYTNSRSFVTARNRNKYCIDSVGYSMAPDEIIACQHPDGCTMKEVKNEHQIILKNDCDIEARKKYLSVRWEQSPRDKYYYPAATSWRYGWVQPPALNETK